MLGERANRLKARILSGKHGRRCGGHKCEGERALPGEICQSAYATGVERRRDGLAEVSRGHSTPTSWGKARTCKRREVGDLCSAGADARKGP